MNKGKKVQERIDKIYNKNIVGYLSVESFGFDNTRLKSCLTIAGKYNGNGFYLRDYNYIEKLPMFSASRYTEHENSWKVMSMIMKTADKSNLYNKDVKEHKLDEFLLKNLFWVCATHYSHMRSLNGSDGRLYLNQLCLEKGTLGREYIDKNIKKLGNEEKEIIDLTEDVIKKAKQWKEYNSKFKYNLYQLDDEINIKIPTGEYDAKGNEKMDCRDGDFNNQIKEIKEKVKNYYRKNIEKTLFDYEFLK